MPDERRYVYKLAEGVRLRARFRHDRGSILEFMIQLEAQRDLEWRAVVRYDNAHGHPHRDIIDTEGREIAKFWLQGSNRDILTAAISDIKANWVRYLERYNEGNLR